MDLEPIAIALVALLLLFAVLAEGYRLYLSSTAKQGDPFERYRQLREAARAESQPAVAREPERWGCNCRGTATVPCDAACGQDQGEADLAPVGARLSRRSTTH